MLKKLLALMGVTILMVLSLVSNSYANVMTLNIPIIDDSPQQHLFYHELLETALQEDGFTVNLVTKKLPQLRIKSYLDSGLVSIFWLVESAERNKKYVPVEVGLTNGLIGNRVLFIKKGDQHLYDNVKNLDDFRNLNLVGGLGENWFDVKVWKENDLRYLEKSGSWKLIFKMIPAGRSFNYFSRGLNEIGKEVKQYPDLAIEKRLALIYDRDFRFYLSKTGDAAGAKYKNIIEHALIKAKSSGLIERLIEKYWGNAFKELNYENRIKIHLKTPK